MIRLLTQWGTGRALFANHGEQQNTTEAPGTQSLLRIEEHLRKHRICATRNRICDIRVRQYNVCTIDN